MIFKTNIHMKDIAEYLQNTYQTYVFKPDCFLNLIEIFKLGDEMMGIHNNPENVLWFEDDGKNVSLMVKTSNQDVLNMAKQARDMLKEFNN